MRAKAADGRLGRSWAAPLVLAAAITLGAAAPGYVGLGIQLKRSDDPAHGPRVVAVVPKSSAGRDGRIKEGDEIAGVETDGKVVEFRDKPFDEIVTEYLRGHEGTKVKLLVVPKGGTERKAIELTREPVEVD